MLNVQELVVQGDRLIAGRYCVSLCSSDFYYFGVFAELETGKMGAFNCKKRYRTVFANGITTAQLMFCRSIYR